MLMMINDTGGSGSLLPSSASKVQQVYAATSQHDQEEAYDSWAEDYERDISAQGYRIPGQVAALFARFVSANDGPFLDAGCGTGLQLDALNQAGYRGFTGFDLSLGMLRVAGTKGYYDNLIKGALGEQLPFQDNFFAATLTCGTITQGHSPANAFFELVRVTRPGGKIVFTLRNDEEIDPMYNQTLVTLQVEKLWTCLYEGPTSQTMPFGEQRITHKGWVFEVL